MRSLPLPAPKRGRTMTNDSSPTRQALGIGLEEFDYPYPVGFLPVVNDLQTLTMAYMDVPPSLLDAPRPGGYIVKGEHFLVEHAPLKSSSAGTVIVQAGRHLLDF